MYYAYETDVLASLLIYLVFLVVFSDKLHE